MTDEPKKPLPFSGALPEPKPTQQDPESVRAHLMELVAYALREGAEVVSLDVPGVRAPDGTGGTVDLGDWTVTAARVS